MRGPVLPKERATTARLQYNRARKSASIFGRNVCRRQVGRRPFWDVEPQRDVVSLSRAYDSSTTCATPDRCLSSIWNTLLLG